MEPYYYLKESGSTNQPREKDLKKDGTGYKEGTLIKSTVDKTSKMNLDIDSKEHAHQPYGLKDKEETSLKALLPFSIHLEESNSYLLISWLNQSLMRALDGMK